MSNIQKYKPNEIQKYNAELQITKHPCLFDEVLAFVVKMNICCCLKTEEFVLEAIASELTEFLLSNKINRWFSFDEFQRITKAELYKKEVKSLSVNLFISTFNDWMNANTYFISKVKATEPPPEPLPKVDIKEIAKQYWQKFLADDISEIEIEYMLPNIYGYLTQTGKMNYTEAEKQEILGDKYLSPVDAEKALKNANKRNIAQYQINKGYLVHHYFKTFKKTIK